ncbi:MAG: NAD(P)H-dependent oxidoreductase [Marinilabiliaceae bacterium]|nr:NAD(P)H-dependent oxidoreductase [Marinilabiliaceae bacterium]
MKHLIIYAHPSENSFSNRLNQALVHESVQRGWEVEMRDLYALNFDPVLGADDLAQLKSGSTPISIHTEQKFIREADVISFVYPLWWAGFPAIMKGYIDRVLAHGFAFKADANGVKGLLKEKRVYLYTSMGNSLEQYEQKGLLEAFRKTQGGEIFEFCGMEVVDQQFFPQIPVASEDKIQFHIDQALTGFESATRIASTKSA